MTSSLKKYALLLALACSFGVGAQAITITTIGTNRQASLADATAGGSGTGNPSDTDIQNELGLGPWIDVGSVAGADGSSGLISGGLLTVNVTSGSWGSAAAGGTWAIAPSFWTTYGNAAISIHVGNGQGDPDHFSFLILQGSTSGTWSYQLNSGGGGGLSNLHLWGDSGTPPPPPTIGVPDGGSTLLLSGLALSLLAFASRRFGRKL
jgi:hypothetical protein